MLEKQNITIKNIIIMITVIFCVQMPQIFAAEQSRIISLDWSEDGTRLAVAETGSISVYDQSLNLIVSQSLSVAPIYTISLSPDGTQLYAGDYQTRQILDSETLQPLVDFSNTNTSPFPARWNSSGTEIMLRDNFTSAINFYSTIDGTLLRSFTSSAWSFAWDSGDLIWSPNDLYVARIADGTVYILNANSGDVVAQHQFPNETFTRISWSFDSSKLALASVADVEVGSPDSHIASESPTGAVRFSIYIIDAVGGNTLSIISELREPLIRLAWNREGTQLVGADGKRGLYVWDPTTKELIDSYLTPPYRLRYLKPSPYNGRLLTGYDFGFSVSEREESTFVPISTFAQMELDGGIQFVAPLASPGRAESILSQCVADPVVIEAGRAFINAGQYTEFNQWVDQQSANDIPPVCADDLKLVAEATSVKLSANAGADQTITDSDGNGSELITLDGSASNDPDGTIVSYSWLENDVEIATGVSPQVTLPVGEHTITLTVTDDDGLTSSDDLLVTITAEGNIITGFTLIDADNDVPLFAINDGDIIDFQATQAALDQNATEVFAGATQQP